MIFALLASVFFVSCKSVKVTTPSSEEDLPVTTALRKEYHEEQVRNDFRAVSEEVKNKFLKSYKADTKEYSILFFTKGFEGERVVVTSGESSVYDGSVKTNKVTGLAKNMRINNTEITIIYDEKTDKGIVLNSELAKKHKFIYVMKDINNEEKPYKVTFSDLLRPEK